MPQDCYNLRIAEIAEQRKNNEKRQPFPHQQKAFDELSTVLTTPINDYRGTLLVLPTGGGKTFTSINWICRNIIPNSIKVLWLAQSSYLLDQAADTFIKEIHNAVGRDVINLRVVSSSTSHSNSGSISVTDDILICTIQTAISAYSSEQLDGSGNTVKTPFRNFIDNCKDTELFVVVDEAQHTPAYGCRTLLLSMREEIKNLYILGLTATPMHMNKSISGWLNNIYDRWICYEADKSVLQANKILSVPKYIEKDTGREFDVDDTLYDRLINKHKDLPDYIIEKLASARERNDFIVSDYINNKSEYGKTLIFADRWFQCEYIVEKLREQGIRANAVYTVITGQDKNYRDGTGRRNNKMNEEIMQDFRDGKYDVIVNVKMLTEGVDVPDVKTVMITRQTTSSILLTQMIGRALRGEKMGGGASKDYANIVFFHDTWKRVLPWANIQGGTDDSQPPKQGRNPMELISINLVKLAVADIEFKAFENADFLTFVPVGFFNCEYTLSVDEDFEKESAQELIPCMESIVVYEFNKDKYDNMIDFLLKDELEFYVPEHAPEAVMEMKAKRHLDEFFDTEKDNFDGLLISNIAKIVRHIAQKKEKPKFIDFNERNLYDMDRVAENLSKTPPLDAKIILKNIFNDEGKHWRFFYKNYKNFKDAFDKSMNRILADEGDEEDINLETMSGNSQGLELTDEIRRQVFSRDNFICLCCGKGQRTGVSLNIDHVIPVSMGGTNAISNLQTLCRQCNKVKGKNRIDFRITKSMLGKPKNNLEVFDWVQSDYVENSMTRIVNTFYHCKALCSLEYSKTKRGQFYSTWKIVLYQGNDPDWLGYYKDELLKYVQENLRWGHVTDIIITN